MRRLSERRKLLLKRRQVQVLVLLARFQSTWSPATTTMTLQTLVCLAVLEALVRLAVAATTNKLTRLAVVVSRLQ